MVLDCIRSLSRSLSVVEVQLSDRTQSKTIKLLSLTHALPRSNAHRQP